MAEGRMAKSIKPIAKSVFVCDDVVRDSKTGKVSLLNIWDAVRAPVGSVFPFCLAKLCVFAWWRDGFGKVRTRVDIVHAATGNVVRRSNPCVIDFEAITASVFARYKLENCVFPAPGFYYIELFCGETFVDDQIIQVLRPER